MDNPEPGRSAGVQLTVRPAAKEERAYKPEKKLRVALRPKSALFLAA